MSFAATKEGGILDGNGSVRRRIAEGIAERDD